MEHPVNFRKMALLGVCWPFISCKNAKFAKKLKKKKRKKKLEKWPILAKKYHLLRDTLYFSKNQLNLKKVENFLALASKLVF